MSSAPTSLRTAYAGRIAASEDHTGEWPGVMCGTTLWLHEEGALLANGTVGRVITFGAAALLVASCIGPGPTPRPSATPAGPSNPPTPTMAMSSPSPEPSPVAAIDAAAWYPVSIFPDVRELGSATMTAVTPTWFGFLAVGWSPAGGTSWWSRDGRDWTAALFQDPSLRNATLTGVAASADRVVAIGTTQALDGTTQGRIWTSADGLSWTPTLSAPSSTFLTVNAVIRTATQFVAIGGIDDGDGQTVTWTSPDGAAWTETALDVGGAPVQLADGPAGLLVLDLVYGDTGDGTSEATLIGPSGTTRSSLPPGLVDRVAAGPGGYWAFAAPAGEPRSPIYRSTDGLTWTTAGSLPRAAWVGAAVVQNDGSVIAATEVEEDGVTDQVLRSADGATWTPVAWPSPMETGAAISGLAIGHDGVIGVGTIAMRRAATWIGHSLSSDPPGPLARDPEPTGCPAIETWSGRPAAVLDALLRLSAADRLACVGTTTIRVAGFLGEPDGLGGACAESDTPEWLTGGCPSYPSGWLQRVAAPFGRADTLDLFDVPSLPRTLKDGRWIVATGHYDDPRSSTCRAIGTDGHLAEPVADSIQHCREHFVVTKIAVTSAPPAAPSDPAALVGLPATMQLAPAFQGWDNLVLPAGTTYGFREITPPAGAGVVVAVFRVSDPASARDVERAVLGDTGVSATVNVLGVPVAQGAAGSGPVFVVGSRIFRLEVETDDTSTPTEQAASLQAVLEALIRAALAG
jgi:hypothetical protein